MEIVLLILILLVFFIRSTWFQTFVAHSVADYLSAELNTTVVIDEVQFNDLEWAEIKGVYIEDLHGDTLVYAPHMDASMVNYSWEDKFMILRDINANESRVKIQKYEGDSVLNFKFIVDYFTAKEKKEKSKFTFKVKEIDLTDSHVSMEDWNFEKKEYGIDYKHINLKRFGGKFFGFRSKGAVTTMEIQDVYLADQSGFILDDLDCFLLVNPTKVKMEKLHIATPYSDINTEGVSLRFKDYGDFSDFVNSVNLFAGINDSKINTKDLSYFVPAIQDVNHTVRLSAEIHGPINDITVENLFVGATAETYFNGNIEIRGLPDIQNSLIDVDINVLQTSKTDFETIDYRDFGLKEPIIFPEEIGNLGTMFAMGSVVGYYNDFDLNMDIITDAGVTTGDFICKLDSNNKFSYDGVLSTAGMDLAKIINSRNFGNFTSNLIVKGEGVSLNDIDLTVEGDLNRFDLNGYSYEEVLINGRFHDKSFKGNLVIADQNLDLTFDGGFDLNRKPYQFSFDAEVQKANLYDLHLINDRESASVCFSIMADGNASNIDDFTGLVYFTDVAYYENAKDYVFESIMFESKGNTNYHTIDVFSEFANISMEGEYNLDTLDKSLYYLGAKVLPSIFPNYESIEFSHEDFDLSIEIQDLSKLTELFFPKLLVSNNTELHCDYNSDQDAFELYMNSEWVEYGGMRYAGIELDTTQKISGFSLFYTFDLSVDTFYVSKNNYLQNINLIAKAYEDNIGTSLYWAADDSSYWAKIYGDGYVMSTSKFEFDVHDSQIYSEMGLWNLDREAHIHIDSTSVNLENLLVSNDIQSVKLDGFVSENPEDKLNFEIIDFNLENFNGLTGAQLEMDGLLDLDGYISNVYHEMYFDAYTFAEFLTLNGYYAGNFEANSNWNVEEQRMEFAGELIRSNDESDFRISKGHYYIKRKEDNIDFQFDFDKTDLTFVNAFMPEGMNLQGNSEGTVYMKGSTKKPLFNGSLFMNNTAVTVDMLNVTYTANGQVLIEPDMILLNGIPIKDKYGSEAFLVGSYFHQNFEHYNYDFFATFDKPFLVMNTDYNMNPLYYGDAFLSGDLSVNFEEILDINVNAKSEKGTNITLPLYGSEDVVLQDFITFVNEGDSASEYHVDLEGINLNLSMDLTEDAEIQLVFDEVVGDVMKGKGVGHIDMYIDQFYDFYMFGNYEISEGSYLFTLKEFINKKFQVKPGSNISWYGDPYEADIDIKAYYPLKASLYDIMPENERGDGQYNQKTDVECIMHLTQSLFNPNIGFDILLPRSNENAKTVLKNMVSTEQEMNKQVFSLLILNKFLPRVDAISGSGNAGAAFGKATTSEVLSNQLSNMISNFSDNFDIGFNYRPGDQISNDEVAIAMSTQLFNDQLTVKTNVGVSSGTAGSSQSNNSLIGDVDVEYKLNPPEGNLRIHAFNQSNEYDITRVDQSRYTQGVGTFYQESFDSFGELVCKVGNLFRRKEKEGKDRAGKRECISCYNELTRELRRECREDKKAKKKGKSD